MYGLPSQQHPSIKEGVPTRVLNQVSLVLATSNAGFSMGRAPPNVKARHMQTRKRTQVVEKVPQISDEDYIGTFDDEGSDWEQSSKQRAKRRKKSHKRSTTKSGSHPGPVLFLPLDIIFEVFSWLTSRDLIILSRTSKAFRQTLMHRGAIRIWKLARERDSVPEPPPNMSEPGWAALVFDSGHCSECGTSKGVHTIDFAIQRRACVACRKQNIVHSFKFKKEYPEYDEILMRMIPHTTYCERADRWRASGKFYWRQDIIDISAPWATLQAAIHNNDPNAKEKADEFLAKREELVKNINEGLKKYRDWHDDLQRARTEAQREISRKRQDDVTKRFTDMGYLNVDVNGIHYRKEVYQPRPLTERTWKRIRPVLEASIQEKCRSRLARSRKEDFKNIFLSYLASLSPRELPYHPVIMDVLELPVVHSAINAQWNVNVTKEDLAALLPLLPEAITSWREAMNSELREKVLAKHRELQGEASTGAEDSAETKPKSEETPQSTPPSDPLNLATSIFCCSKCKKATNESGTSYASIWFGWEGVLRHGCWDTWVPLGKVRETSTMDISERGLKFASELIRDAGLDPETATMEDMDNIQSRYFCKTCTRKDIKHVVYDWRSAVAHAVENHILGSAVWEKLNNFQLMNVRHLNKRSNSRQWACAHCNVHFRKWDRKAAVEKHLSTMHLIDAPVEGQDVLYFFNRRLFEPLDVKCEVPTLPPISALEVDSSMSDIFSFLYA